MARTGKSPSHSEPIFGAGRYIFQLCGFARGIRGGATIRIESRFISFSCSEPAQGSRALRPHGAGPLQVLGGVHAQGNVIHHRGVHPQARLQRAKLFELLPQFEL